jgi:glycosyltransferase involved in cell wall biosynthesis
MKIALTTDSFVEGQGGVSTAVAALARSLRQRGHLVMVYTAADPAHNDIDLDIVGLRAFHYEHFPGGRAPLAPLRLTQKLANFDPDVIHNHSMGTMGIQALAASNLLGIPIVGTCHVFLAGFLKYAPLSLEEVPLTKELAWRYTTSFFNRFPQVTTPSEVMRRELISHGLRVPVSAISNGVDINLFCPKEEHGGRNDLPPTLLHVGRLSYEKRIDVVIRAFARLSTSHPHARLVIVGEGPEKSRLHSLVDVLGISKSVDFEGFVPHDQLPSFYTRANIFVTASTIETQGLVALEAMACGLPVVSVNAMALPDLVKHEVNGYLVPPDDEAAFAEAVDHLLCEPDLRQSMGQISRDLAISHSLDEIASNYECIYLMFRRQPRSLFIRQLSRGQTAAEIWRAFQAKGQALKEDGEEKAREIMASLQERSGKIIAPVTERLHNRFSSQSFEKQPDHHEADLSKQMDHNFQ